MARSVADLELMLEAMAGPDKGDTCAAPVPIRRPTEAEMRGARVGYFEDDGRTPVTPETRAAVRAAADALKRQGFEVTPFQPQGLEHARQLWWVLFGLAGGLILGPMIAGHESELSPILREFADIVAGEPRLTTERLLNAWLERDQLRAQFLTQMEEFAVLLCPTCSVPAFRHRERQWRIDGKTVQYLDAMSYSQWFNLLGNPAAVVPVGSSPEGLPIGVQIVGRLYEEQVVLAIAAQIERGCGGWKEPRNLQQRLPKH